MCYIVKSFIVKKAYILNWITPSWKKGRGGMQNNKHIFLYDSFWLFCYIWSTNHVCFCMKVEIIFNTPQDYVLNASFFIWISKGEITLTRWLFYKSASIHIQNHDSLHILVLAYSYYSSFFLFRNIFFIEKNILYLI